MPPISRNNISAERRLFRFFVAAAGLAAMVFAARLAMAPARGLQAEYFAGDRPGVTPVFSGVDPVVSTDSVSRRWYGAMPDAFSAQWFGYFTTLRSGRYTFALTSDDAAVLSIDGRRLIDNGGRHAISTLAADIELPAGPHAVLIEFTQFAGDFAIEWQWGADARSLRAVPSWAVSPYRVAAWRVMLGRALDLVALVAVALAALLLIALAWLNRAACSRHPRWATLGLFLLFAIAQTWPTASDPGHLVRHDNRDTMLNEWIVSWVAHQAPRDPVHLFDANIFYPERHALAYSEPMLPQGIMALPLVAVGASPVLIYNLLLIAGFTLTGWSMCLVVRSWTGDWAAAVLSGTILAFNAHVLSRIPHLQAQHVEFLPAALFALDALLTRPNVRRAVSLACWAALQATTSIYLLAATLFALAAGIIARPQDWLGRRFIPFLRALAVATLLAVIVLVPFLLPYYHVSHDLGLSRSLSDADMYAATWKDYLSTPSRLWYSWWSYRFFAGTALFPGAVGLILSAVALAGGDAWRDSRARLCLAVGIAGVALSFGPRMPGYSLLYTIVPVLRAIRATARFGYLATLAVAALAGFGAVRVRRMAPASMQPAIMATLIACAFAESVAAPLGLTRFDGIPPIYARVPRDSSTRVVEIPFFGSTSSHFHASYMLNSTAHWRPIVNGYSGFQPPSFYQHADALQGFPDATSIKLLHDLAVTHVFVHTTQLSAETRAAISQEGRLKLVETFGSIALYRLE